MIYFLRILVSVAVAACVLQQSDQSPAADWPQWMGPELNGISLERGWSTDWPQDGLRQVWTTELGIGFSSVSVVNGHLYTMGHNDGMENGLVPERKNR